MAAGQIIGRVSVKVMPDTNDFRKEAKRQLDRVEKTLPEVKAKVTVDLNNVSVKATEARLTVLARPRKVDIVPVLNTKAAAAVATQLAALGGARVLNNALTDIREFIANLDKSAPLIGTLAAAMAGLSAFSLTAASNLFALSSSLAQIGPAALLLPGIFGGIAIGIGTMVAAFKDFNEIFPDVKTKLSQLQNLISRNFWAEAREPFREMIDDIFPRLSSGLAGVSTQLGAFFGNLAGSLTSILGPELGEMFDGLSQSIDIFADKTDALVGIITTLGNVGASRLPQLAGFVGDLAERFNNFLAAAAADGRLQQWIDTALQATKDLGSATADFFGILSGIGRAALDAGGSSLGIFADTLDRVHNIVDSPAFQTALTGVFEAAHIAMGNIATQSGPAVTKFFQTLADLLMTVMPQAGNILGIALRAVTSALSDPAVTAGILNLFNGLETAVRALEPAMVPLAQAFGAILSVVGSLLPVIADLVVAALVPLSEAFVQLTPTLRELIPILGQAFLTAIQAITPYIPMLADAFAQLIVQMAPLIPQIAALIPPLVQVAVAIIPPLIQGFLAIVAALMPLITEIAKLIALVSPVLVPALKLLAQILVGALVFAVQSVTLLITGLINVFRGVIDFVRGVFTGNWSQAWSGIQNILKGILQAIAGAIGIFLSVGMLGAFAKGFAALRGLWTAGWNAIKALASATWSTLLAAFQTFMRNLSASPVAALNALKTLFREAWSAIQTAMRLAWDAMVSAIKGHVSNVVSIVAALPGQIVGAFRNAPSLLVGIGRSIIEGLISGITAGARALPGVIGGIKDKVVNGFKSVLKINSPAKVMIPLGESIVEGLEEGIKKRGAKLRESINKIELPKDAPKDLKVLVAAHDRQMDRLVTKWNTATEAIKNAKDRLLQIQQEAAQYAARIADNIIRGGDISATEGDTYDGIVKNLKESIAKAREFYTVLTNLKKAGLDKESIDQLASAGPDAALEAAKAIAGMGKDGIHEINLLQKELAAYATAVGKTAASAMYDQGINVAAGFVQGITQGRAAIEKQMVDIAKSMVKTIKKELGIRSPSRVMAEMGVFTMEGLLVGMESQYSLIRRSLSGLSDELSGMEIAAPSIGDIGSTSWAGSVEGGGAQVVNQKNLYYYAAPGSSLGSEEDLFAATSRPRAGW